MKAVILAAGVGSRLRPLTDTCAKPMLPIAGRPLLARTLDWLRASGVDEAALNLHHLPDSVRDGLGDGTAWGMRLRYSYEPELLGSGGALRAIAERFPGWLDQTFLLVYGDMLIDVELRELLAFHRASRALMTLALKRTTSPRTQGMVELGPAGRVEAFVEKPPSWTAGDVANAGLYLCEPALLDWLPGGVSDFGRDLIPALVTAGAPVFGRLVGGYLLDIGTPAAYEQAQREWAGR
jgi:NDP-sugar pyrophosphorylase family protein